MEEKNQLINEYKNRDTILGILYDYNKKKHILKKIGILIDPNIPNLLDWTIDELNIINRLHIMLNNNNYSTVDIYNLLSLDDLYYLGY